MNTMKTTVETILDKYIEEKDISGGSVLLYKDGKEVLRVNCGFADIKAGIPFKDDTIIRLYSMTKPITAAAVMILLERGVIERLDPVSKYIPSFKKQYYYNEAGERVPVSREMTIGDLLDMRGGLCYPDKETKAGIEAGELFKRIEKGFDTDKEMTTAEVAEEIGKLTLAFDPGSNYRYSTSADVLGAVVEKAGGSRFSDFLYNEIFKPLEMHDTGFFVPEEKQDRLAKTYVPESHIKAGVNDNEVPMSDDGYNEYLGNNLGIRNRMEKAPSFESGGAGLSTTLDDYMKFAEMLLNKGTSKNGHKILNPQTLRFMTERWGDPLKDRLFHEAFGLYGFTYGNLLRICEEPGLGDTVMIKGEYGWDGWTGPYFANIPSKNATLLIAIQRTESGTYALTRRIINALISEL